MGRHSTAITPEAPRPPAEPETLTPPTSPASKKRKRDSEVVEEIEVDINAPEPPSKKALRKTKRAQSKTRSDVVGTTVSDKETSIVKKVEQDASDSEKPSKRSDYGIWIGNLSWTTTKNELRTFFEKNMADGGISITRIHLPPPSQTSLMNSKQKIKPVNKGFAYVDFETNETFIDALSLSEKLFSGRKVLIKDAKSFEGRPEKPSEESQAMNSTKPPSKRVFVGNLGYDTTREDVREHFSQCGEVDDVFLTTFEDSGKCKGYGWVTFVEVEAAQAAIRGWVNYIADPAEDVEEVDRDTSEVMEDNDLVKRGTSERGKKVEKPKKQRKWWVNRFQGRPLRMEFAEGKDVRYKKRYGKGGTATRREPENGMNGDSTVGGENEQAFDKPVKVYEGRKSKVDARTIKPGAALAAVPRHTAGIIESTGKKTSLD